MSCGITAGRQCRSKGLKGTRNAQPQLQNQSLLPSTCSIGAPVLQMRGLPLMLPLMISTLGESLLYRRLAINHPILRPFLMNGFCWGVGAAIDFQRRKLFLRTTRTKTA
jgi:hypothetical protein